MTPNPELQFLLARRSRVKELIAQCPEEAVFERSSLLAHLDSIENELRELDQEESPVNTGTASIMFDGDPVYKTIGIKADFAPKAIESFQELVDARRLQLFKKSHKNDKSVFNPQPLLITGTPRGSFGFKFEEMNEIETNRILGNTLTHEAIKESIEIINTFKSDNDEKFKENIKNIDRRSIHAISDFFEHAKDSKAIVKFNFENQTVDIKMQEIIFIVDRAKQIEKEDEGIELKGKLTGLMINARKFEFQPESGKCFSGSFSKECDPGSFSGFLKGYCLGLFHRTREIKQGKGQKSRWKWDLVDLTPLNQE